MSTTLRRFGAFGGAIALALVLVGCGSYTARDSFARSRSTSYTASHMSASASLASASSD